MPDDKPRRLTLLARSVLAFIVALIVAGVAWHGVTVTTLERS